MDLRSPRFALVGLFAKIFLEYFAEQVFRLARRFTEHCLIYEYIHIWICVYENDSQLRCDLSSDMAELGKWVMRGKSLNGGRI